jgi:hypothetical protein
MSLYPVLAFLIPLPLFYDVGNLSFVIYPIDDNNVLQLENGVPIPVGLATLAVIILFSLMRKVSLHINKAVPVTLSCLAVFCIIAASRVDMLKLLAVLLPVLFLLVFSGTVSQPRIVEKIAKGYLFGLLFQAYMHVISILNEGASFISVISASRTFFGYEIYQALVSYSAVLSAAGGAGVIYALSLRSLSRSLGVLMLTVPVYIIVIFAARKAAIVDLAIIYLINVFLMLHMVFFSRHKITMKRALPNVFLLIILTFVVYISFSYAPREISLEVVLDQRGGSYEIFKAELFTAGWVQVMTGYASGWGGYSNFIVELIVRSGLIGMVAYLLGLAFATRRFYHALINPTGGNAHSLRDDIYINSWFVFALGTIIIGNIANLNIQLPYYSSNFFMINICFVYYYTQHLKDNMRISRSVTR